eukprot:jgi/Bigna1/134234/aug1.24_g8942
MNTQNADSSDTSTRDVIDLTGDDDDVIIDLTRDDDDVIDLTKEKKKKKEKNEFDDVPAKHKLEQLIHLFGKTCAICMNIMKPGERVCVSMQCSHGFHTACLLAWNKISLKCPQCRVESKELAMCHPI